MDIDKHAAGGANVAGPKTEGIKGPVAEGNAELFGGTRGGGEVTGAACARVRRCVKNQG